MTETPDSSTTVQTHPNPEQESDAMQTTTHATATDTKVTRKPATPTLAGPRKPKAKRPDNPKPQPARAGLPLMIGLDKLCRDPANVRPDAGDVDDLAASIAAHGVIQPLTVRPEMKARKGAADRPTGRYLVVAGGRRLRALLKLAAARRLPKDAGVPCVVRSGGTGRDAAEVSLAENVERLAMNPADEHAAFAALADAGLSAADVAARFGVPRRRVEQRLALGRIAPDLLDELRRGTMKPGVAQALTLTADHERQREAWRACRGEWNPEVVARRVLASRAVGLDDPLMRLVGRDAYEAAGGAVRADLFADADDAGGFADDGPLVRRLAADRLDAEAEKVRAEGWAFVAHELQAGADPYAYRREQPERREATRDERERLAEIEEELNAMEEQGWDDNDTPEDRAARERWDRLEAEHEAIEAGREGWTTEQRRRCGVFLSVGASGRIEQRRGLIDPAHEAEQRARAEERRVAERATADTPDTGGDGKPLTEAGDPADAGGPGLSRTLVARLTKARTEALRATLARRPDAAADLLLAHLCERLLFRSRGTHRPSLPFRATIEPGRDDFDADTGRARPSRGGHGTDAATDAQRTFYDALQAWRSRLPASPDALPAFAAALAPADKLALLGLLAAASLDAVNEAGTEAFGDDSDAGVAAVAAHAGCDARAWWRPTAADLFDHMTRPAIAAAAAEALPDQPAKSAALAGMRKADAAREAERLVAATDWLPAPMRPAHRPAGEADAAAPAGAADQADPDSPIRLAA